ncbi:MAG TPA: hypothetical protein VFM82_03520 [Flavobacteriaceae bacterium]|nr:hypothetical protein [Flavobacteriaceae bacterium]
MKKVKTLLKDGIEPFKEGKKNFDNPIAEIEQLAKERLEICKGCEFFKKEPISFLSIKDERIKEFSEMVCGDCGCELPYKSRQTISICKKWQR